MSSPKKILAAALGVLAVSVSPAHAGHGCECGSDWQVSGSPAPVVILACPQGDGPTFLEQGWWIDILCLDHGEVPFEGFLAVDFWLVNLDSEIVLCGGVFSVSADSATNSMGMTTMSTTTLAVGGCSDELALVGGGFVFYEADCVTFKTEAIHVRSPDIDGSLLVDLVDLSLLAASYPPMPYETCSDFDVNGAVNLQDLSVFAAHYGPPGHACN